MSRAVDEFITYLRRFNRKERFFLVGWALGNREFRLAPAFRRGISSVLSLDVPSYAFAARDYHLDWIYASAFLAATGDSNTVHPNKDGLVSGSQEDIDLVVAFSAGETAYLIGGSEGSHGSGWSYREGFSESRGAMSLAR